MGREALSIGFVLLVYGVMGLGPAAQLVGERSGRLGQTLALAPTLGYGLVALLAFPLVRFVGPATDWAWPLALVLAAGSLALFARHDRGRAWAEVRREWRRYLARGVFVAVLWPVLMAPLLVRGIPYAVFRSNPSDAYTYLGWAENLHTVDWQTLRAGAELSSANAENLRRLALASPAALLNARHLDEPMPLSGPAALAWVSALTGVPVYRLYYANNALAFLLAGLTTLALTALLPGVGRLKYAVAGVVSLGVWSRFILETDAAFQITALPLVLALGYAWMRVEQEPLRPLSWPRVFLGGLAGLLLWFYVPVFLPLAVAAVLYYGAALVQRLLTWRHVLYHGLTGAIALAVLTVTGQVDFALRNVWRLLFAVEVEGERGSKVLDAIADQGLALLWGWPRSSLVEAMPAVLRAVVALGSDAWAVLLTLLLATTVVLVLRRSREPAERLLLALALAGPVLMVTLAVALGNAKPAGQAFLYGIGFFVAAVVLFLRYKQPYDRLLAGRFVPLVVVGWCLGQMLLGAVLPFTPVPAALADTRLTRVRERFDLEPILATLAAQPPSHLLVFAPDALGWPVAFHTQLALAPYRPYFAHGLILDNTTDYANFWVQPLPDTVDYAVLPADLADVDYGRIGEPVAAAPVFVLYRVTPAGVPYLLDLAREWRAQELAEPPFPTLAP